jgi:hypothetical protein
MDHVLIDVLVSLFTCFGALAVRMFSTQHVPDGLSRSDAKRIDMLESGLSDLFDELEKLKERMEILLDYTEQVQ